MERQRLNEDQQRTLWFVRIRWLAIGLILLITLYLNFVGRYRIDLPLLLALIITAALYNLIYPAFVRRFPPFSSHSFFIGLRVMLDLLVVTAAIHASGGVESPFRLLYLLELVTISMFGMIRLAYISAVFASSLFYLVCVAEALFFLPHYRLSHLPGSLYLTFPYINTSVFTLLATSFLLIYLTSFLANKFRDKQREVIKLSNAKADFMNQVIHETKSPLTSIIGYADIILKGTFGAPPKELQNPLQIIQRQSGRILEMTNNLLDIARLESGLARLDKSPASLNELIEHVVEEMKPVFDSKGLEVLLELDPSLPRLNADSPKLSQVITNLLSNAQKFSGQHDRIVVSTQLAGDELQLSVRDEGLGIDLEDLPHIFEKFHRAGKEAAEVRGTGLGLALSRTIIEAHGGRIWANSAGRSKGAVLHFTLPIRPAS